MKYAPFTLLTSFLCGCAGMFPSADMPTPDPQANTVCQGFGCKRGPGAFPDNRATHKPTRDEKIRVRQGLPADFGSENIYISFPTKF
ncbi:hypothetical protein [Erwinia pyrifoliae]|uniref:Lipoprotein n=1 Tax=Erwinia pyrifoliae TaxID=79967 RepID=A0ABY5XBI9_ERWPY|nr:hypothetical protein [Erwinia pyrifoliae]AUX73064.1 hypothetical protein CPI84_11580 [Erwinia pyrifoliae]MCA8876657.1 hypothetical protein [Erwinia pyrifoliae]MCT2386771.1 hypothetical protein [Erwinia pyrifoliae]MCU8587631.1 hypothetical protein [Erwinia pyrifoliae]UWS31430.1 hypothetical protein NYP81_08355 [Erwinia pyrifoliae]